MKQRLLLLLLFACALQPEVVAAQADAAGGRCPEFSTAGFFALDGTGREVFSLNPAWRFCKGDATGAEATTFDDSEWEVVSLPHGIEYLPAEASGCVNYQGTVWYRKHFTPDGQWRGKRCLVHFEAIMGKSRVYVNGRLVKEHFGGYLPVVADVTDALTFGRDNVIAVCADNSDDPTFPPGKPQDLLDYTYCGGIYRDCWLVTTGDVHLSDPNLEDKVAGGGLFVAFSNVSGKSAEILLKADIRNDGSSPFGGTVDFELIRPDGTRAAHVKKTFRTEAGSSKEVQNTVTLKNPLLWAPAHPTLYQLLVRVKDSKGHVVDGYRQRIGIRTFEFRGKDGFYLNGQPYGHPLVGANRHQEFAVIGNAVPNSLHWRDAFKLRNAGLEVIRNAHCPQDPAFMDACDELGLLVINNTPGWQFWNNDPVFAERVYNDIRNLVRRDRNHACMWLWEPILNETHYPADFAGNTIKTVNEEYPYSGCYCASDIHARGAELFPVQFTHPKHTADAKGEQNDPTKTYFTREWGDNVDNWNSHNSNSRAARNWGEQPMLVQAQHYAAPAYDATSFDVLYRQSPQHVGGCLWHSFDHQRGYHPDPFYGGLMDVFRQPKYSYYMFMSQRPLAASGKDTVGTGPMVFIAHEMTPFSGKDVQVYSNCEEVRLTVNNGGMTYEYRKENPHKGMPSPIITFADAYNFMVGKNITYHRGSEEDVFLLAEGLVNGKVVATHKVSPARRPEQLLLWVDDERVPLRADGSDCVVVIAAVADRYGNIKRLNNDFIQFEIEGEGRLLGDASIMANPTPVRWGTAPIVVQATTRAGEIKIRAHVLYEGEQKPASAEITLHSTPAQALIYDPDELEHQDAGRAKGQELNSLPQKPSTARHKRTTASAERTKEVEEQQKAFGE